ncbi:MAG: Hpt domain-containing protein [Bacteroidota bacterium]
MLDLSNIRQISGGDESFVKGILTIFLSKEQEYAEGITRELANKNYDQLRQVVHKIKSSISVLGMNDFKKRLNELELGIEKGFYNETQIAEGATKALEEFGESLKVVRAYLKAMR